MSSFEFMKPVEEAWNGMMNILFRPFRWGVWAKLGLLAWLACLFESGGFSIPNFKRTSCQKSLPEWLTHPTTQQLYMIIGVALAASVAIIIVLLIGYWIKARGRFLFIDGLLTGVDTPFLERWSKFKAQGNSLFAFELCWFLGSSILLLIPTGVLVLLIISLQNASKVALVGSIVGMAFLIFIMMFVLGILLSLVTDFGTVLMYKNGDTAFDAAKKVFALAWANLWSMVKYYLVLIAINVAIFLAVLAFLLVTCCCIGGILLMLPYVWAVVMLPALAFRRLFTIAFIARAGEEFDLLSQGGSEEEEDKAV